MIKKFYQFINENDSTYINWEEIEEVYMSTKDLPDCVPQNVRQWQTFIGQYEKASDLVNGKWEPHYNWKTEDEFNQAVNEQFYLGKGFKNSIYECFTDLMKSMPHKVTSKNLFKNVNWEIIECAYRFTTWNTHSFIVKNSKVPKKVGGYFNCVYNNIKSLKGYCPEYVGGNFYCHENNLTTLEGCPEYVGGNFNCSLNKLTSLEGCPEYVGKAFDCSHNKLTSLEGCPEYVGENFNCSRNKLTSLKGAPKHVGKAFDCSRNNLTSLEGAPKHVGGNFYCDNNKLPKFIPLMLSGKDLPKYIDL